MPNFRAQVPGVYPLGSDQNLAVPDASGWSSSILNTRDLGQPGAVAFVDTGPGSQVWIVGYAIRILSLGGAPTNPLGLRLVLSGSLDIATPYTFVDIEAILLPFWQAELFYEFVGRARVEHPAAIMRVDNNTGQELTVSYQFWGKAS